MALEKKILNCITCPMGCELTAELVDGVVTKVTGNTCPRGEKYAQEELTHPQRMLTSTVRIEGGVLSLLPVVSAKTLPKERIGECAAKLRQVVVNAPVKAGDTIVSNILGLGVDIVASRDMAAK
jgi:CxxC motif-containing protein